MHRNLYTLTEVTIHRISSPRIIHAELSFCGVRESRHLRAFQKCSKILFMDYCLRLASYNS